MNKFQNFKQATLVAAASLTLACGIANAADNPAPADNSAATVAPAQTPMSGKQKATAIGAGTGAVAGAVVGGPVGALVGAGVGAYVGHEGTDAKGHVSGTRSSESQVKKAQSALNEKGYNVAVDGRLGPNTQNALRDYQAKNGLTASGTLNDATLNALGLKG